jgi:hypothetical protein
MRGCVAHRDLPHLGQQGIALGLGGGRVGGRLLEATFEPVIPAA